MSDDEGVVLVVSSLLALVLWVCWYVRLARMRRPGASIAGRRLMALAPPACGALLLWLLRSAAAHDVRDAPQYLALYFALGAAWVGVAILLLALLGLSAREDVLERANRSAAFAIAGALAGVTLAYAGGNVGDGPGWWVVLFSSGLATATLALVALVLERVTRVASVVTVDRDDAAGLRLGGFFVASGLVLGRAAAGDWESASATFRDFVEVGWPVAPLLVLAALVERTARPAPARPSLPVVSWGVVPALLGVALAILYVVSLGPLP